MFMCRWMNGDVSFVSARTKDDAIVMLDEWDNAEGAEISQIRDFMVDFRLNDEGDLELAEFGESCRDTILEKAYPRLLEATDCRARDAIRRLYSRRQSDDPQSSGGGKNAPAQADPLSSARNRGGQNTAEEDGCLCGVRFGAFEN